MISAIEALALPTAQLSKEEADAATKLVALIDECVRKEMRRNGIELSTPMTHPAVIAEVNQRLRRCGWETSWQPMIERHALNQALTKHTGFKLSLYPSDESYKAARPTNGVSDEATPLLANS
jgi:hypothetical protein